MRSRMFQMRMSSYRNLRFNFEGTYGGALGAFVGWYLLAVITVGILYPVLGHANASQYTLGQFGHTARSAFTVQQRATAMYLQVLLHHRVPDDSSLTWYSISCVFWPDC